MHPIELFHVEDIHYLVGATIVLHNMMVEERIERDQVEQESFYNYVPDLDPHYQTEDGVTQAPVAEQAIREEDERFAAHAADSAAVQREKDDADLLGRNLRFVMFYWKELYDPVENLRLQNAVKGQLYREEYGDDADGNVVADFDPLEDFDDSLLFD